MARHEESTTNAQGHLGRARGNGRRGAPPCGRRAGYTCPGALRWATRFSVASTRWRALRGRLRGQCCGPASCPSLRRPRRGETQREETRRSGLRGGLFWPRWCDPDQGVGSLQEGLRDHPNSESRLTAPYERARWPLAFLLGLVFASPRMGRLHLLSSEIPNPLFNLSNREPWPFVPFLWIGPIHHFFMLSLRQLHQLG